MRKFLGLAVVIALLSFVTPVYGSVAVSDEYAEQDSYVGEASSIKFEGQNVSFDGSQVTVLCNGHKDGVTTNTTDKVTNLTSKDLAYGVIILNDSGSIVGSSNSVGTTDTQYISLADGTAGQMVTIQRVTGGSGLVITDDYVGTAGTKTGWDDIYLDAALDQVTLLYVDDTYGWVIIGGVGVTIT